jgi:transcriptional regulator with XRE-family HTH domain
MKNDRRLAYLRRFLRSNGLKQRELAEHLGLKHQTVRAYAAGSVRVPEDLPERLARIDLTV